MQRNTYRSGAYITIVRLEMLLHAYHMRCVDVFQKRTGSPALFVIAYSSLPAVLEKEELPLLF